MCREKKTSDNDDDDNASVCASDEKRTGCLNAVCVCVCCMCHYLLCRRVFTSFVEWVADVVAGCCYCGNGGDEVCGFYRHCSSIQNRSRSHSYKSSPTPTPLPPKITIIIIRQLMLKVHSTTWPQTTAAIVNRPPPLLLKTWKKRLQFDCKIFAPCLNTTPWVTLWHPIAAPEQRRQRRHQHNQQQQQVSDDRVRERVQQFVRLSLIMHTFSSLYIDRLLLNIVNNGEFKIAILQSVSVVLELSVENRAIADAGRVVSCTRVDSDRIGSKSDWS